MNNRALSKRAIAAISGSLLLAVPAAHAAPVPTSAVSPQGKKILFLIKLQGPHRATDDAVRKHLESLGFSVTYGDDTHPPKADGYDMIAISATCQGKWILGTYKDARIPIVTWKPWLYPYLGMTGMRIDVSYGEGHKPEQPPLWLVNQPAPVSAHLPNGLLIPVKHAVQDYSWGKPGLGAETIATLAGEPDKAVIFSYEKGALMAGDFAAPSRRVALFMAEDTFDLLNDDGLKLFDAAFLWAAQAPPN